MTSAKNDPSPDTTVSHLLGEMTWLLTQSPLHRELKLADLEWLIMPAILAGQFYVFREDDRPVGLALWARCDAQGEAKLERGMLDPANRLTVEEWTNGDRLWLVDLIAPFATAENRQIELMIADLLAGPLSGQEFRFHRTEDETGKRSVVVIDAGASERLKAALASSHGNQGAR